MNSSVHRVGANCTFARVPSDNPRFARASPKRGVDLHQQHGPLHTSITAIAQRAGVERLTVYRHFPNEASLHEACQQHFFASHPLPNLELWREVSTFPNRLAVGLSELYEYWQQTHKMFSSVLRDHEVNSERSGAGVVMFMSRASDALLGGQDISGHHGEMLSAAVGHAVHFYTWRSLVIAQGVSKADAAKMMCDMIIRAEQNNRSANGFS